MTHFKLDRIPVKRRARINRRGRAYVDVKTQADLKAVREAYKGELYECPVKVTVVAYRPIPKSKPKKIEVMPFTSKPDVDNIGKAILDGLNGVAYRDDSQVTELRITKAKRFRYGNEFCMVWVEPEETDGTNTD